MSLQDRTELVKAIGALCDRYPHWRFGQLVSNLAGWADVNIWDVEDDQILEAAKTHLDHLAKREEIKA